MGSYFDGGKYIANVSAWISACLVRTNAVSQEELDST